MRGTMIVYAHPEKLRLLAEHGRFAATRTGLFSRLYAAWLVFSGRADAIYWPASWPRF
jgi:hypothetical protein